MSWAYTIKDASMGTDVYTTEYDGNTFKLTKIAKPGKGSYGRHTFIHTATSLFGTKLGTYTTPLGFSGPSCEEKKTFTLPSAEAEVSYILDATAPTDVTPKAVT